MLTKEAAVRCEHGLDRQSAAYFIRLAVDFKSTITLTCREKTVNAKSLLGVLSLDLRPGETVTFHADGSEEEEAAEALSHFLTTPSVSDAAGDAGT